jgi:uncharacterized membrane protein YdbT with pleckstrin-like domain
VSESTEQLIWNGNPSQIQNLGTFIICGLVCLTIVGAILAIPFAIWRYLVTRCQSFKLTDQRLVISSGVLNKKNEQVELFRVKDIAWEEPLLLRLFKLGRLTITSTDRTDPIATINAIQGGEALVETFRTTVTKLRQKNRVGVIETM